MQTGVRPGPEIWLRGPAGGARPVPPGGGPSSPPVPSPGSGRPAAGPPGAVTPRRFSWLATHGGAGATTLAAVYGGQDCGREWPRPADPSSVLLVARTHASGLDATVQVLELFRRGETPGGLDLDAVVLVADAPGRLPRPLDRRIRLIESVIDVYRVPWVPAWRLGDLAGGPPREAEALARLTGAAGRIR
ncbi:DUF6668 family protein [Streptomyces mangrovisoli]|uniref:Uncharacterized protein n=1 Tax=Streptomyces mangrovisoli TaxID=1428628 RepID=A0A1J4NWI4_9ACTN|nr:DUF6668 family protein [Streptomyces mangrovisoli]OIJ66823.1 hypothetical protein WN71_016790 [Streptomyces mangrovisoli]